jgi:hypothetical protein
VPQVAKAPKTPRQKATKKLAAVVIDESNVFSEKVLPQALLLQHFSWQPAPPAKGAMHAGWVRLRGGL